jgi:flagellar motility protein MotE (MotC chaperone)
MENVAKELAEQRGAFARREAELASRETRIAAERKAVDEARAAVEKLRTEIDARLVQVHAQEQKNLKSLVATYGKLSPPAAVAIFKQMDDTTVAKLLALMKPEIATAVFEEDSRDPGPDNANVRRVVELTQRMRLLMPLPEQASAAR